MVRILDAICCVLVCALLIWLVTQLFGCVQVLRLEEGTEGVLYHLRHPATQPVEIGQ